MSKLFVISAPSGAGKTSLIRELLQNNKAKKLKLGISCTTRNKRTSETDGKDYFFFSKEKFDEGIEKDHFLEYAEVFGNYYGTPRDWVMENLKQGFKIILELDYQGAYQIKERFRDAKTIFIIPPNFESLEQRLVQRGLDSKDVIKRRLSKAFNEINEGKNFDNLIANENFEMALEDLETLVLDDEQISTERTNFSQKCLDQLLDQKTTLL
tara:strand:+ start:20577 stop:21209 length:633 start_codon:yes stop_codon:yes gene_type:complete